MNQFGGNFGNNFNQRKNSGGINTGGGRSSGGGGRNNDGGGNGSRNEQFNRNQSGGGGGGGNSGGMMMGGGYGGGQLPNLMDGDFQNSGNFNKSDGFGMSFASFQNLNKPNSENMSQFMGNSNTSLGSRFNDQFNENFNNFNDENNRTNFQQSGGRDGRDGRNVRDGRDNSLGFGQQSNVNNFMDGNNMRDVRRQLKNDHGFDNTVEYFRDNNGSLSPQSNYMRKNEDFQQRHSDRNAQNSEREFNDINFHNNELDNLSQQQFHHDNDTMDRNRHNIRSLLSISPSTQILTNENHLTQRQRSIEHSTRLLSHNDYRNDRNDNNYKDGNYYNNRKEKEHSDILQNQFDLNEKQQQQQQQQSQRRLLSSNINRRLGPPVIGGCESGSAGGSGVGGSGGSGGVGSGTPKSSTISNKRPTYLSKREINRRDRHRRNLSRRSFRSRPSRIRRRLRRLSNLHSKFPNHFEPLTNENKPYISYYFPESTGVGYKIIVEYKNYTTETTNRIIIPLDLLMENEKLIFKRRFDPERLNSYHQYLKRTQHIQYDFKHLGEWGKVITKSIDGGDGVTEMVDIHFNKLSPMDAWKLMDSYFVKDLLNNRHLYKLRIRQPIENIDPEGIKKEIDLNDRHHDDDDDDFDDDDDDFDDDDDDFDDDDDDFDDDDFDDDFDDDDDDDDDIHNMNDANIVGDATNDQNMKRIDEHDLEINVINPFNRNNNENNNINNDLEVKIINRPFGGSKWSKMRTEQCQLIRDKMLQTIERMENEENYQNGNLLLPSFERAGQVDGVFRVTCSNLLTKQWLIDIISKWTTSEHLWHGACLEAIDTIGFNNLIGGNNINKNITKIPPLMAVFDDDDSARGGSIDHDDKRQHQQQPQQQKQQRRIRSSQRIINRNIAAAAAAAAPPSLLSSSTSSSIKPITRTSEEILNDISELMYCVVPDSLNVHVNVILERIHKQNRNLNTSEWKIIGQPIKFKNNLLKLCFRVPNSCVDKLVRDMHRRVFYGLSNLKFRFHTMWDFQRIRRRIYK